ncbi:LPS biosynthesis glycosyltransferase [Geitlerinema sp. P-1104]|uniref:LPS biosynthesis glycosyltransferase n=1 Tax=Geitlerinema sp. P-1104 TaxID=2546230 RepID=UPI0014770C52|nr:LPS biosynthesis glycosyltransferase [Geitlerinema sp. P-1104]NMG57046.1 LPS biosynthesis glycosyltransferase [Geitlerinema sp. P-1104]
MNTLVNSLNKVFIIAYKETTDQLEAYLKQEGFDCEVVRQENRPEYQDFSPSYRCLLNHCQAWEKAAESQKLNLIIEADFVPVKDFGKLPLPFPKDSEKFGISWIYTCAPQVYWVSEEGYAQGFSTSAVAYILSPKAASCLTEFADKIGQETDGKVYSTWDSQIDTVLRSHNFKNFIPFRNYGEHGGIPNPEHRQNGLSPGHQADVLWGEMAFTPLYHQNYNPLGIRLKARAKGIARLLKGNFLRRNTFKNSRVPWRLLRFSLRRQLTPRL